MKKNIDMFLRENNYEWDSKLSEGLAKYLTEELQYMTRERARHEFLKIMKSSFKSKIESVGGRRGDDSYLEGYADGLREGLEIIKDIAE